MNATFDPFAATFEEACAHPDPLAVSKLGAAARLLAARDYYEAHLPEALALCLTHDLAPPAWISTRFVDAVARVVRGDVRDWNAAFGEAHARGTNLARLAQRQKMAGAIWRTVLDAVLADPTRSLDELIEAAGRQHGAGRTLADELFRSEVRRMGYGAAHTRKRVQKSTRKNLKTRG